jgi:tetratricopeptide (TPR) repeat protein
MTNSTDPIALAAQGKRFFEAARYPQAIEVFTQAAATYAQRGDAINKAELDNNLSVALLQSGQAKKALEAAADTDQVFAQIGDQRRQAMALGNQAAALEALRRLDEALTAYERSAELFAQVGEGEMHATVLKAIAALKLRRGKLNDSAITMLSSLEVIKKPSLPERFIKFLLRLRP